mmetsp:Transcript_71850/g.191777  ORF Transcript_71850/g.191777 Transcript_71850/m.191777 type:complete len:376 (+) Transcript_71850:305-1432(+)
MSPWQPRGEEQHLFISKNNLQSADSPPLLRGQREEALLCPAAGPLRAGEAGGPHLRVLLRAHTGTGGRPGVGPGLEVGLPRDELAVRRHRPRPLANALVAAGQVRGARGPGVGRVLLEGPREDVVVLPRGSCGGGEADIGPPRLQPHRVLEAQWRVDHRRVHVVDEDTQTAQAVGLYKLEQVRLRGPAGLRKGVEVHARRVHHAHRVLLPVLQEALGGPHPAELPHACRRAGAVGLVPVGVQGHVQVVGVAEVRVVEHVELHSHALRQATVPQLRPGAAHRRRSSALDHEGETVAAVQAEFPHVPLVETPVPPQALVPLLRHDPPAHLTPLQLHLAAAKSVACRDLQQEGGLEPVLHPLRRCVPRRPGPPGRRRG